MDIETVHTKPSLADYCRWHDSGFQSRSEQVVNIGRDILGPTALTNGAVISPDDNAAIDLFFAELTPNLEQYPHLANWEGQGSLLEHCRFAGEIAYKLAVLVNEKTGSEINPDAQKAALKLHDLGRAGIHSFMETDELTDSYWRQIGLREDIHDMTHSAHLYWGDEEPDFDELSFSQRISVVADTMGKRARQDTSRLRHADEVLEAVKEGKKKYLEKENRTPYEEELVVRLDEYTRREQYIISSTLAWFEEIGINLNDVVDQVMCEYEGEMACA